MEDLVHNEIPNIDGIAIYTTDEQIRVFPEQSRVLPEELSPNVVVSTCDTAHEGGICNVYLVGTSHVSQESCREVQAVISYLKPQVVFLELCPSRVSTLLPTQSLKVPTMGEMIKRLMNKDNIISILHGWFVGRQVAYKLKVFPGSEFRVAYEEAKKYGGIVILGDRPVELKDMDDVDKLTLKFHKASKKFPTLMDTLLHERDQFMSDTLLRVGKEHQSVVACGERSPKRNREELAAACFGRFRLHSPIVTELFDELPPFFILVTRMLQLEDLYEMHEQKRVPVLKIFTSLVVAVAIISGIYLACLK